MIARLVLWWKNLRQWRQDHKAAFAAMSTSGADGVTVFQAHCLETISEVVPRVSFERIKPESGDALYLVAPIPNSDSRLFIYNTEAGIHGPGGDWRFEEWDFRTPTELIEAVVQAIRELPPKSTVEIDTRKSGARPSL